MPAILVNSGEEVRSLLFSFVPKTGGTAIMEFFKTINAKIYLHDENNDLENRLKCPTQHFHYDVLKSIYRLENFDLGFSVVRNPIDRAKSDYLWFHRALGGRDGLPSFDRWFGQMMDQFDRDPFVQDNHFRPQHEFIGPLIDQIYRYEDGLEGAVLDIFDRISTLIDFPTEGHFMPKINAAEHHFGSGTLSRDVAVSPDTIQRLIAFYREDFELFYPDFL